MNAKNGSAAPNMDDVNKNYMTTSWHIQLEPNSYTVKNAQNNTVCRCELTPYGKETAEFITKAPPMCRILEMLVYVAGKAKDGSVTLEKGCLEDIKKLLNKTQGQE